jgi:hypothetical protein
MWDGSHLGQGNLEPVRVWKPDELTIGDDPEPVSPYQPERQYSPMLRMLAAAFCHME